MVGRGMDDAGVDGRTAHSDQDKTCQREDVGGGQEQRSHPCGQNPLPQTDHLGVIELEGDEPAERTPDRDAGVEQTRKSGGGLGRNALCQGEVAAGPVAGRRLEGAVTEEAGHDLFSPRDAEDLAQTQGFGVGFRAVGRSGPSVPERQTAEEDRRNDGLKAGHRPVAAAPALPGREGAAHQHGADDGAHAPHTVQPAHVVAFVVEGDVVVQGGVDAACTEAIGYGPEAEHPEGVRCREAEEGKGGQGGAEGSDPAGAERAGQPVALQAGHDGAQRGEHGEQTHGRDRYAEHGIQTGPCGAQQGIRQPQTDESQIDDRKQKLDHGLFSS